MAPQVKEGFIHVEGKLYDADTLSKLHPGGQLFVQVARKIQRLGLADLLWFVKLW